MSSVIKILLVLILFYFY